MKGDDSLAEPIAMKQIKGDRLYVELNASHVRRRLKGHGFGVRKVESAGTHRAVIIHTATGQHLRELEQLFQDVIVPPLAADADPMPIERTEES
jgi:hypothetical protein